MKCAKCGNELPEGAKFCGNCGNTIEANETVEAAVEDAQAFEEAATESVEEVATDFASEVSNEPVRQEIVNEELPFDTKEFKENQEKSKKNSKAVKWILIILGIVLVAAALVFAYFKFFTKESYEKSVDSMEKAVSNLVQKENASGTIKVKLAAVMGKGEDRINFNVNAFAKYAKVKDKYAMQLKVDKTMFTDELDMYMEMDDEDFTIYTTGSLISLIFPIGDEYSDSWYKFGAKASELGLDLSEIETNDEEIDLSEVLNEKNFKYVDKKNGLKHYQLTITDEDLKGLTEEVEDQDLFDTSLIDLDGKEIVIDVYLSTKNELKKIEVDFMKIFEKEFKEAEISKLLLTIEFENMNSTKVEVPADVKLNSIDLTDMTIGNIYSDDYTAEDIYYDIMFSGAFETCENGGFVVDFKNYNGELDLEDDAYDVSRIQSGKLQLSLDPEDNYYCTVQVVEPIVIDGKTCTKDTDSYSNYAGICE